MIDILKNQIELKIGKKITSRGDCEMISNKYHNRNYFQHYSIYLFYFFYLSQ